jgi:spermidine synthase
VKSAVTPRSFQLLLLLSVFVVATCGLIYELVAGTLASYLLGDSITQFSTIIGTYLFSMGIGSWFSRYFKSNLIRWFVQIEILVGIVGGFSSSILYLLFEQVAYFRLILYLLIGLTGVLVGLELPLLMRILKDRIEFSNLVSQIFTFDYIGALLASIIFPIFLIPLLGIVKTSLVFGLFNVVVALFICYRFREEIPGARFVIIQAIAACVFLACGIYFSERLLSIAESMAYSAKVIYAKSSPYQRIIVTKEGDDLRLFLNGNLQFSSRDEYRYHEALVHPGMSMIKSPKNILILGGGDGLAVREVLKYPSVEKITLVDLDPSVTRLFKSNSMLLALNHSSLLSPKVHIVNQDAFLWVKDHRELQFDFVIIDFPDPSNFSLGKLYSTTFYRELAHVISPGGASVIQSTSPYFARKSFWIVDETLRHTGFETLPYHCYIPSFGEWGFVLAANHPIGNTLTSVLPGLHFISPENFVQLTFFPSDMNRIASPVNTLNDQLLVQTFEKEWAAYTP